MSEGCVHHRIPQFIVRLIVSSVSLARFFIVTVFKQNDDTNIALNTKSNLIWKSDECRCIGIRIYGDFINTDIFGLVSFLFVWVPISRYVFGYSVKWDLIAFQCNGCNQCWFACVYLSACSYTSTRLPVMIASTRFATTPDFDLLTFLCVMNQWCASVAIIHVHCVSRNIQTIRTTPRRSYESVEELTLRRDSWSSHSK